MEAGLPCGVHQPLPLYARAARWRHSGPPPPAECVGNGSDAYCRMMADTGIRRVVPSDLYPLVLGFLRDNQLSEVANKFAKATGAVSRGLGARAEVG